MCVGALSTSKIDKGDGPGFSSDVATASLGLFIKIQDDIDFLVLTGISHVSRARTMRSIARIYACARACGRFKINNNDQFRIFLPIIQLFIIVSYYSKFVSRIISAGTARILMNGSPMELQINTGAEVTVITEKVWRSMGAPPIISSPQGPCIIGTENARKVWIRDVSRPKQDCL